jgi:8-oxo-dGTP pyrophosphatase MutT (NUDIX family)
LADGRHFLLVEHRNAGLWLPTGGHVEPGESPNEAASREAKEELGIDAQFLSKHPLFITSAETVGKTAGHTDVSLWFVILHSRAQQLQFDKSEFRSIQWFHRDDLPLDQSDPNMGRFVEKLLNCPDFR